MQSNPKFNIKQIFIILCLALIVVLAITKPEFSVQQILDYAPQNVFLAAVVIIGIFALKSITFVFPIIVIQIATGHLFSVWGALLVNLLGLIVCITLPYFMGRILGMEKLDKFISKYPALIKLMEKQNDNTFFLCFFLRVISCLPGDVVTLYLGATKAPFMKNLIGGVLGTLPTMILATLMGTNIQNPDSYSFWILLGLTILLSLSSILIYHIYRKKTNIS